MDASYTKLKDGSWGVRLTSTRPVPYPGMPVTVVTKAGTRKRETLSQILTSNKGITTATLRPHGATSVRCSCQQCCAVTCHCYESCACRGGVMVTCMD